LGLKAGLLLPGVIGETEFQLVTILQQFLGLVLRFPTANGVLLRAVFPQVIGITSGQRSAYGSER